MDANLQKALTDAVVGMTNTLVQVKDFSVEQAPDVIRQFLEWSLYYNLTVGVGLVVLGIVLLIITGWMAVRVISNDNEIPETPIGILCCMLGIISLFAGFSNLIIALQIYVAPKVFLIQQAAALVK